MPTSPGQPQEYTPIGGGHNMRAEDFLSQYNMYPEALSATVSYFCWLASAGSLVGYAAGSVGNVGFGVATMPLGRLYQDGDLEMALSQLCQEAFEVPLTLDRISGDVRLRVGKVHGDVPPMDHPTAEYARAVQALAPLEHQGDGIKSFLGAVLAVVAGRWQILLIDEPEAFLHPGQARSLGRWLATEAVRRDVQVVLVSR